MHLHPVDSLSGLSVDSPAFRQRAPHVQLSDDPDTATEQTVAEMCRQIHQAAGDPMVKRAALSAVCTFHGGPGWAGSDVDAFSSPRCMADSCWWWCNHYLRFKHHGSMFEAWSADLGDPRIKLQLLIAPDVLVRMNRMEGDCAIYTMMLCALLESLGLRWEIVTAAVDARQPEIFSHVWPRVVLSGGNESLDASHGKYPGWQVPSYDLHRVWIFNDAGVRVGEQGGRFTGLHDYRARRGMGADGDYGGEFGPADTVPVDPYLQPGGTSTDLGSGYFGTLPAGAVAAPSQSSAQWASFATNLAKMGFSLAQINAIQPGTVVSANGAILRQNPGYPVGSPTGAFSLGTGMSTSTLLIGGLVLAGIFFMSMGRR